MQERRLAYSRIAHSSLLILYHSWHPSLKDGLPYISLASSLTISFARYLQYHHVGNQVINRQINIWKKGHKWLVTFHTCENLTEDGFLFSSFQKSWILKYTELNFYLLPCKSVKLWSFPQDSKTKSQYLRIRTEGGTENHTMMDTLNNWYCSPDIRAIRREEGRCGADMQYVHG
jgi:hypothetical protein